MNSTLPLGMRNSKAGGHHGDPFGEDVVIEAIERSRQRWPLPSSRTNCDHTGIGVIPTWPVLIASSIVLKKQNVK